MEDCHKEAQAVIATMVVKAVSSRIGLSAVGQRVVEEINAGGVGRKPCRGTRVGQLRVDGGSDAKIWSRLADACQEAFRIMKEGWKERNVASTKLSHKLTNKGRYERRQTSHLNFVCRPKHIKEMSSRWLTLLSASGGVWGCAGEFVEVPQGEEERISQCIGKQKVELPVPQVPGDLDDERLMNVPNLRAADR